MNSSNFTDDPFDFYFSHFIIGWNFCFFIFLFFGFIANAFIIVNVISDQQMRNTNYFFVLNLVFVDIFVILGVTLVNEIAVASHSQDKFLVCFPIVWNFVVNYTASNYILLFLCYEKLVLILLPFQKDKYLSMRVKVVVTLGIYLMTLGVAVLKFHYKVGDAAGNWCIFAYPILGESLSDVIDMLLFFAGPIITQILLYSYLFYKSRQMVQAVTSAPLRAQLSPAPAPAPVPGPGPGAPNGSSSNPSVALITPQTSRSTRQHPQIRVAKTCLVATGVRFVLWLPYVIHLARLALLNLISPPYQRSLWDDRMDLLFPNLTMMASCTNPLVFIFMSPPLQRRLVKLVCFLNIGCCKRPEQADPMGPTSAVDKSTHPQPTAQQTPIMSNAGGGGGGSEPKGFINNSLIIATPNTEPSVVQSSC